MKTIEGKIVVLGHQGVGKTSLVVRYIGKMFSHHISPTIGASFFTCKINTDDARVKLQVWDTAGQERFRAMAPMYYRNANAALLVFDITQYHTFTSVKTWVKELQRNVQEPMVLNVVGNKVDLADKRKVPYDEAAQYAASIGGNYFEVSAMHDQGIEEVFVNTALGLVRLSGDSRCTSLRVYDSSVEASVVSMASVPNGDPADIVVQDQAMPQADSMKAVCCQSMASVPNGGHADIVVQGEALPQADYEGRLLLVADRPVCFGDAK